MEGWLSEKMDEWDGCIVEKKMNKWTNRQVVG